jgi:hypothetical protein
LKAGAVVSARCFSESRHLLVCVTNKPKGGKMENIKSINNEIRVFARRAAKHIAKHASYYMFAEMDSFKKWEKKYIKLTEKWVAVIGSASDESLEELHDKVCKLIDRMVCVKDIPK